MGQILQAIYFPQTDLLSEELGSHPSQVWRALLEGRDALKLGLIRRIGNGQTTDAWFHNWILRDERLSPIAQVRADAPRRVSSYIDSTSASWNMAKLEEFFLPMDVEVIRGIPLCTRIQQDFWAWHFEKNGIFTIRSAYRLLANVKKLEETG
jgi:hypothetical protein